jgi:hypothetical protein
MNRQKMDQPNLDVAVKRPHKPRFVRVICRHARRNPGSPTHKFPIRLVIRYSALGLRAELSAERPAPVTGIRNASDLQFASQALAPARMTSSDGAPITYQYKCPRCRYDLQLRTASMLRLIGALDALERQRTGNPTARVQRLDISSAEHVLASLRQAGEAP